MNKDLAALAVVGAVSGLIIGWSAWVGGTFLPLLFINKNWTGEIARMVHLALFVGAGAAVYGAIGAFFNSKPASTDHS